MAVPESAFPGRGRPGMANSAAGKGVVVVDQGLIRSQMSVARMKKLFEGKSGGTSPPTEGELELLNMYALEVDADDLVALDTSSFQSTTPQQHEESLHRIDTKHSVSAATSSTEALLSSDYVSWSSYSSSVSMGNMTPDNADAKESSSLRGEADGLKQSTTLGKSSLIYELSRIPPRTAQHGAKKPITQCVNDRSPTQWKWFDKSGDVERCPCRAAWVEKLRDKFVIPPRNTSRPLLLLQETQNRTDPTSEEHYPATYHSLWKCDSPETAGNLSDNTSGKYGSDAPKSKVRVFTSNARSGMARETGISTQRNTRLFESLRKHIQASGLHLLRPLRSAKAPETKPAGPKSRGEGLRGMKYYLRRPAVPEHQPYERSLSPDDTQCRNMDKSASGMLFASISTKVASVHEEDRSCSGSSAEISSAELERDHVMANETTAGLQTIWESGYTTYDTCSKPQTTTLKAEIPGTVVTARVAVVKQTDDVDGAHRPNSGRRKLSAANSKGLLHGQKPTLNGKCYHEPVHSCWRIGRGRKFLFAKVQCALEQPKPFRANEARRMINLCQSRVVGMEVRDCQ